MSTISDVLSVEKFYSKSNQKDQTKLKNLAGIEAVESVRMYRQQVR